MDVKVQKVEKMYGDMLAVKGVSFSFSAGQIVGFIGPNGAGKTTTIKMIATLHEPTRGDILFDDVSVIEEPEEARRVVGYMPDALPEHRDTTVRDYLDFFARAYGLQGRKRRLAIEEIEEFTQLGELRHKVLFALSKGMKQRVSLARALIHNPSVLIMDEPAAGLDPRARIELRELLKVLADQGKSILLSSHILTELSELCTHAVFIEQGRVLRAGSIDDLLKEASSRKSPSPKPKASQSIDMPTSTMLYEESPVTSLEGDEEDVPEVSAGLQTTLLIRVMEEQERLMKEIVLLPHVEHAECFGQTVEVDVQGGDDVCCGLLRELMKRDFSVVEFHQQGNRLEELFMNITKGQVQ